MYRSVRAFGLVACMALLGACGDDGEQANGDGPAGQNADGTVTEGGAPAFALVRGEDTLLIEQFTLTGDRVSGTMRDPSGSSIEYQTSHAAAERTMQLTLRPSDPAAGPPITSRFTLRGDSAWLETTRGDSTIRNGDELTPGALPYMSPSMGMMALVVQSAREIVGDSGQVPLLAASVSMDPVLVSPLVYWRADTAFVIGDAMNQFKLVFSNGQLVSAENAPQQMRAVRLPAGASITPRGSAQVPAQPPAGPASTAPQQQP